MLPTAIPLDSAYAEAQPPPPPIVRLVSATDLHPPKLQTLTMHEDLPDKFERAASPPAAMAKGTRLAGKADKALAFAEATPIKAKPGPSAPAPSSRQSAPPPSLAPPSDPGSPLSDLSDDASDTDGSSDSDGGSIACPTGLTRRTLKQHQEFLHEMDKDNRDAEIAKMTARLPRYFLFHPTYSLAVHQGHIQKLAKKRLDLDVALSFQDEVEMKRVFTAMEKKFPVLKKYAENWPARCLLQAHLKVTSDAAKNAVVTKFKKEVSVKPVSRRRTASHQT